MPKKISRRLIFLPLALMLGGIFSCAGQPPKSGLVDGHLRPCPNTPNCLSSESSGPAYVAPIPYTSSTAMAWQNLKKTIADTEGVIVDSQPGYLRAVYTSQVLRFEDDLEFRLDEAVKMIQLRSASRSGYWDLGANRRRVEWLRRLFGGQDARNGR